MPDENDNKHQLVQMVRESDMPSEIETVVSYLLINNDFSIDQMRDHFFDVLKMTNRFKGES